MSYRWLCLGLFPFFVLADIHFQEIHQVKKQLGEAQAILKRNTDASHLIEKKLALLEAEKKVYQNALYQLSLKIRDKQAEIKALTQQISLKENKISQIKTHLARMLKRIYLYESFPHDSIENMFGSAHHQAKAQDLVYMRYLRGAENRLMSVWHREVSALNSSRKLLAQNLQQLKKLKDKNQQLKYRIDHQQRMQHNVQKSLSLKIRENEKKVHTLTVQEKKLNQLIIMIAHSKNAVRQKAPNSQAISTQINALSSSPFSKPSTDDTKMTVSGNLTPADLELTKDNRRNIVESSESLSQSSFSKNKGYLQFPVHKGTVRIRYGQKRADGSIAKGFVIQSSPGEQVVSVGPGQVAYVGRLPGYDNVVIIQHDQIYITVYTGLVSIGPSIHSKVDKGTSLGVVGNSSEIYFELRENAHPVNPQSWF